MVGFNIDLRVCFVFCVIFLYNEREQMGAVMIRAGRKFLPVGSLVISWQIVTLRLRVKTLSQLGKHNTDNTHITHLTPQTSQEEIVITDWELNY